MCACALPVGVLIFFFFFSQDQLIGYLLQILMNAQTELTNAAMERHARINVAVMHASVRTALAGYFVMKAREYYIICQL